MMFQKLMIASDSFIRRKRRQPYRIRRVMKGCAVLVLLVLHGCTHSPGAHLTIAANSPIFNENTTKAQSTVSSLPTMPLVPALVIPETGETLRPGTVMVIRFDPDSSNLSRGSLQGLDLLADKLVDLGWSNRKIYIQGHTDDTGDTATNFGLSYRRAHFVKQYLHKRTSIPPVQFKTIGFGELRPLVKNTDSQNRYINRRVEVKVSL